MAVKEARDVMVIVGSASDLPQCMLGFEYLQAKAEMFEVNVLGVFVRSWHRHMLEVQKLLVRKHREGRPLVLVMGAGWANHLTGSADAWLRYHLSNTNIHVIGVAFSGKSEEETRAAILSITKVPKTQVIFDGYVGDGGVLRAFQRAVEGDLPELKVPAPVLMEDHSLGSAIARALEIKKKKEEASTPRPQIG